MSEACSTAGGVSNELEFACNGQPTRGHTLLSVAAHALLPCFTTRDVLPLRASCREARDAIAAHPWDDATKEVAPAGHLREGTRITGSIASWRSCFPKAIGANVRGRAALTDAEACMFLTGLRSLDVTDCVALTDAAFAAFAPSLHTLVMRNLTRVTDGALLSITHARVLDVSGCEGITGGGLLACPAISSQVLRALRMRNCRHQRTSPQVIASIRATGVADVPMLYHLTEGGHGGYGPANPFVDLGYYATMRAARAEMTRLSKVWERRVTALPPADSFGYDDSEDNEVEIDGELYGTEIMLHTNHGYAGLWTITAADMPPQGCHIIVPTAEAEAAAAAVAGDDAFNEEEEEEYLYS